MWLYVSRVSVIELWRSLSDTYFGWTPWANIRLTFLCRASFNLLFGNLACLANRFQAWVIELSLVKCLHFLSAAPRDINGVGRVGTNQLPFDGSYSHCRATPTASINQLSINPQLTGGEYTNGYG